jgi:Xaa-Pro aminopeptidase
MKESRVAKALGVMKEHDLDGCILKGMDNIFYLTGFRGSEGALLITGKDVVLLTDFRYATHAKGIAKGFRLAEVKANQNTLAELCKEYQVSRLGFDSLHTTFFNYQKWDENLPGIELVPLGGDIEEIRKCKDPDEIRAIRDAVRIASNALMNVLERLHPGKTEKEVAADLDCTMRMLGAEGASFPTIVASGHRAALPHAEPTGKEIREGEPIIIDFGALVDGYCSDETCTVSIGPVKGEIEKISAIVDEARRLGVKEVRAGMSIKELDTTVRDFIANAGYGDHFGHGTGHGIGVAVHEAPSINSSGEGVFLENMVVTIEPGIYLEGIGGVRLEDMVLITEDGPKVLTYLEKGVVNIGG